MVKKYNIYVEGGGDSKSLSIKCQMGFRAFFEKAGLRGAMPTVIPCGSRNKAYDRFRIAVKQGLKAFLLVDSEAPVDAKYMTGDPESWQPWRHLHQVDGWTQPASSSDHDCHLMVQVMESWFLTDKNTLADFFGQDFREKALSAQSSIEAVSKGSVYQSLKNATRDCSTKGSYEKGKHSFKIIERISPDKVCAASPWAKRFIDAMLKQSKAGPGASGPQPPVRKLRIR